ncbi:MAG TPA: hypothetical protein P5539_14435 [Mesotoga sp.]|nr:hypothetical protein [Mesotoga sp.]
MLVSAENLKEIKPYEIRIFLEHVEAMFARYVELKSRNVSITHETPLDDFGKRAYSGPVITYSLVKRQPASYKSSPFSGQWQPKDPLEAKTVDIGNISARITYFLEYDNLVRFRVYSADYSECQRVAEEFENFMILAKKAILSKGITDFSLLARDQDSTISVSNETLYVATFEYYVRTRKIFETDESVIREITTVLSMN